MKTSIEISEKAGKTILLVAALAFVTFFVVVALCGDLGSIYAAF